MPEIPDRLGRMRECPGCGALAKTSVPVCRWCGYEFEGALPSRPPSAAPREPALAPSVPDAAPACPECGHRGPPVSVPRVPRRALWMSWFSAILCGLGAFVISQAPVLQGGLAVQLRPLGYGAAGFLALLAAVYSVLGFLRVPGCSRCGARAGRRT
ncbi:MAG: hypothetical protein AAB215_05330 [Planctomycetota bacterium]